MKTYLVSLYNQTTGHYSPPILFETKEQAVSNFIAEINAPNSELFPIKHNLSIFCIGRYEHTTGKLHPYLFKKLLLAGKEVLFKGEHINPFDSNGAAKFDEATSTSLKGE